MADESGQEKEKIPTNRVKPLKKETEDQKKAFEVYYSMGERRSLEAVANEIGMSARTVGEWSRKYKWKDRCIQKEIEETAENGETSHALLDVKAKYRKIINNLMANFVKDIKDGKIKVKNIQDYERLVKLDMLLMGDPTERLAQESKSQADISLTEEDRKAIFAVADSIRAEMNALRH